MEKRLQLKIFGCRIDDLLVAFVFVWYFCSNIFGSINSRLIGLTLHRAIYDIIFFSCVCYFVLTRATKKGIPIIACYFVIALLFLATLIVHPEYEPWFFEESYGIQKQFFRAIGGIWAFAVISMVSDREDLKRYLKFACWILFLYLVLRFLAAEVRGGWNVTSADYEKIISEYDMAFGYDVAFTIAYFTAEAYLNKKKWYYIPAALGLVMTVLDGSRGALLVVLVAVILMFMYKLRGVSRKTRAILLSVLILGLFALFILYLAGDFLRDELLSLLKEAGIESRTLKKLLSGDITDTNGRDYIWQITLNRIREGGLFGNGVFGERVAVGTQFRWGYAHNLFLELYAAFGYLGGTALSVGLVYGTVRTGMRCRTINDEIIFITFLSSAMKLMVSDSFWFNRSFWALLALMILWYRQDIEKTACGTGDRAALPSRESDVLI